MLTFYFTGTGNSLAAAKKIGGTLISIPQAIHEKKFTATTPSGSCSPCIV